MVQAQVLHIYTSGRHAYTRDCCVYTPRGCVYTRALVGCGPLLDGWCAAGGAYRVSGTQPGLCPGWGGSWFRWWGAR